METGGPETASQHTQGHTQLTLAQWTMSHTDTVGQSRLMVPCLAQEVWHHLDHSTPMFILNQGQGPGMSLAHATPGSLTSMGQVLLMGQSGNTHILCS